MITAITLTGDRPLAFKLCQKWMANQITKPDQWIVVDDGDIELDCMENMHYIKRDKKGGEPKHTLLLNLVEAFKYVIGDKIIIFEDDDYYSPEYISQISLLLNKYDLVGIGRAKYYHIEGKYYEHYNMNHASLAQTAFKNSLLNHIQKLLNGDMFLDLRIWQINPTNKYIFIDNKKLFCGIKGLSGRNGIGIGHDSGFNKYQKDSIKYDKLKEWIPNDYKEYLKIINE